MDVDSNNHDLIFLHSSNGKISIQLDVINVRIKFKIIKKTENLNGFNPLPALTIAEGVGSHLGSVYIYCRSYSTIFCVRMCVIFYLFFESLNSRREKKKTEECLDDFWVF